MLHTQDLQMKANDNPNNAGHTPDPLYMPGFDAGIPTG